MTTFLDGPAQGQTLMVRRSPIFLRVVAAGSRCGNAIATKWDALDLPDDEPQKSERVFAYRLAAKPGAMHLNTGRSPGGGFYPIAQYAFVAGQPPESVLRSTAKWQAWCEAQPPVILDAPVSPAGDTLPAPPKPPAHYTVERRVENGVEAVKHLPYTPPTFPAREYIIIERATGAAVLVTPGGRVEIRPEKKEGSRVIQKVAYAPQPYRLLKDPHDRMHATRMTADEARAHAAAWKLDGKLFQITKPKNT